MKVGEDQNVTEFIVKLIPRLVTKTFSVGLKSRKLTILDSLHELDSIPDFLLVLACLRTGLACSEFSTWQQLTLHKSSGESCFSRHSSYQKPPFPVRKSKGFHGKLLHLNSIWILSAIYWVSHSWD